MQTLWLLIVACTARSRSHRRINENCGVQQGDISEQQAALLLPTVCWPFIRRGEKQSVSEIILKQTSYKKAGCHREPLVLPKHKSRAAQVQPRGRLKHLHLHKLGAQNYKVDRCISTALANTSLCWVPLRWGSEKKAGKSQGRDRERKTLR